MPRKRLPADGLPRGAGGAAAVDRWETDKKLERKVAQLAKKLEERSKELEVARGQTEQALTASNGQDSILAPQPSTFMLQVP